ncbi:CRN1 [Sanghuangporus sanghuang]
MSRFVRASKYRHVYGQAAKKELCIDNVKLSNNAWDTNMLAASGRYISINWNASGGGAFAILPLPSPFEPHKLPAKLPDVIPLARGHIAPVLDTDWSPHDDALVASAGDDGQLLLWKVDANTFEGWGADKWEPQDFEPVLRIAASSRKAGQVLFHPIAKHVVGVATGDHAVKLWDLALPEDPQRVLGGHGDAIQSFAFDFTGNLVATTCRDRKLRLFDARTGGDAVRVADSHGGIKGARVVWMGNQDRLATTGFSKMSDRQIGLWETGSLKNVKMTIVDQSSGVLMPFYSDNNILFVAGKGDGNIRYYEYEHEALHPLAEYQSNQPQRGMCFLPRRALDVSECEIARAYKVAGSTIEPIAFVVPRKSDSFQADIYPPALSADPALTAGEFFSGKTAPPKLVSLESGAISSSDTPFTPVAPPVSAPSLSQTVSSSSTYAPLASKTSSAPAPEPIKKVESTSSIPRSETPEPIATSTAAASDDSKALEGENERLTLELRNAREQIRNLELQVEGLKANAQKAKALLA